MGEDEKKTFWMIKRKKNPPESFFQKLDEDRKKVKQRKVSKIFFCDSRNISIPFETQLAPTTTTTFY